MNVAEVVKSKGFLGAVAVVVVAAAVGGGIYMNQKQQKAAEQQKQQANAQEVAIKNIFARAHLPVDEDPASSEVKNLDAVKDSEFFKEAKVGDVILFFKKARIAAILRPSEGRVISSAQVIGEIPKEFREADGKSTYAEESVNVAVFNGTTNADYAKAAATTLTDTFKSTIKITYQDSARNTAMKSTVVVDLGGQNEGLAKSIAASLKGSVGDFPAGEKLPPSMKEFPEILVFLGPAAK